MKFKVTLFLIFLSFSLFFIYKYNYVRKINITSINSLKSNIFNQELSNYLNKKSFNYNFNIDYSNEDMTIDNLILKIDNNENNILNTINKSDLLIISVGNSEKENIKSKLKELFNKIRKVNNKKIIYVIPSNIKNITYIQEITNKYNIICINSLSFNNNYKIIAKYIVDNINY